MEKENKKVGKHHYENFEKEMIQCEHYLLRSEY